MTLKVKGFGENKKEQKKLKWENWSKREGESGLQSSTQVQTVCKTDVTELRRHLPATNICKTVRQLM